MAALRVLVVGAGIAGLAFARAARDRGIRVEIVERSARPRSAGAGMYLPGNAVRALRDLGVWPAVAARAAPIRRQRVRDHAGRHLVDLDMTTLWHDDCVAIQRADLLAVLHEAAGDIEVRRGVAVTALDGAAAVRLSDGSVGSYDVVVGADGVRSTVRAVTLPGHPARYVGQVAWRFVADGHPELADWVAYLGRGRSFLTLALGGGRVYCYADVDLADPAEAAGDWRDRFADFAEPVPTLLGHGAAAHRAPIEEVQVTGWATRDVVVVGDAAHATPPNMAQGAALAVEDALLLADSLAGVPAGQPVAPALSAFEVRRAPRVAWVQRQTHRRDRTRALPAAIRNPVLRLAGAHIFESNFAPLRSAP